MQRDTALNNSLMNFVSLDTVPLVVDSVPMHEMSLVHNRLPLAWTLCYWSTLLALYYFGIQWIICLGCPDFNNDFLN